MNIKLAVVVPVYNEGVSLLKSIPCILDAIRKCKDSQLVIVNDGSADETLTLLQTLERDNPDLLLIHLPNNMGYGAAVSSGCKFASEFATHILVMDSDLTNSPSDISRFYEAIKAGGDYIKATRFECGGGMLGVPVLRRLHSRLGSFISSWMFNVPITDPTNGFRAIKVGLINFENIKSSGFASIMEELYLVSNVPNVNWINLPVILKCREVSQSKSRFVYGIRTYKEYLTPALKKLMERIILKCR